MEIVLCFIIILLIALFVKQQRKRVKEHNDKVNSSLKHSSELDNIFDDFMCISVTDGSTIIKVGDVVVRGNARRSIK